MPAEIDLPKLSAREIRSSAAMVFSTASAAAAHTGLPPNVVPCLPGPNNSAVAPVAMQAPIGIPPPSPFARVMTSGTMPTA